MGGDASSCVRAAGLDQKFQSFRVEVKMPPVKLQGKLRRACAVLRVMAIVMTAGVVQQRKKHDHISSETGRSLAEVKTLFQHARPMRRAVQAVPLEAILPPGLDEEASWKRRLEVWQGETAKSGADHSSAPSQKS